MNSSGSPGVDTGGVWTPEPAPPSSRACEAAAAAASSEYCDSVAACTRCLQTWGCMIGSSGYCSSQVDYNKYSDFRGAANRSLVLPGALTANTSHELANRQYWHFRAGDASYCSRSDVQCQQCTQAAFWTDGRSKYRDSRYCLGADGCVCIFNCEFSNTAVCANWTRAPSLSPLPSSTSRPDTPVTVTPVSTSAVSREFGTMFELVMIIGLFGAPLVGAYWFWTTRRQRQHQHDGFVHTLSTPGADTNHGGSAQRRANRPPASLPVES